MKGLKFLIILCMSFGLAVVVFAGGIISIEKIPTKDVTIDWAAMSSVDNTTAYENTEGSGRTNEVDCSIAAVGTNMMSIWPQTSTTETGTFSNATSSAWVINSVDSDTLRQTDSVQGGDWWRFHTEDSDVDVTNTVTPTCTFKR